MNIAAILVFIDIILIYIGFLFSFCLRFPWAKFSPESYQNNLHSLQLIVLLYVMAMVAVGVYKKRFKSYFIIIQKTFLGLTLGILISMSFIYVFRSRWGFFPSSIFLISFPIIFLPVAVFNLVIYKLSGKISKKVVFINEHSLNNINKILEEEVDEIVLVTELAKTEQLYLLLKIAETKRAKLSILPRLYDEILAKKINGKEKPQLLLPAYSQANPEDLLIRICDVVISSIVLFFSLPVMGLVALLIKINSYGPIIYKQRRIGLNGKEFRLYKFRSMMVGAQQFSRPEWISLEEDERVTRIGIFIRRTRLDELPQLFNVIKGDMSLVGPRPEAVYRVKEHRSLQGIRLSVRPGLTGLAQIKGYYHTTPQHKLKYDYLYIKNLSLRLNLNILLKTVLVVLFKPGS